MLPNQRRDKILDLLKEDGSAKVGSRRSDYKRAWRGHFTKSSLGAALSLIDFIITDS
ncbi:hypothetical protein [Lacihabitans sp. CCS-44]|uniref:hypothetical protein n=1 Tax=Lacihabitans sp. CCS-44 TaxID=2487331 RepID=UPI0020CF6F43|nr:hypothetical protein [Lacihabitans sp. CCS-44]